MKELESRLDDDRMRQALADRLLKIALKGSDGPALRAIQEIENRAGAPIKLRIDGLSEEDIRFKIGRVIGLLAERLPKQYHRVISEAAYEGLIDEGTGT